MRFIIDVKKIKTLLKQKIKEFNVFDSNGKTYLELIIVLVIFLFIIIHINPKVIVAAFIFWALLSILGVFVPTNSIFHSFSAPGTGNMPINPGILVCITLKSKGGFIAGNAIQIKLEVIDLKDKNGKTIQSKKEFHDIFEEFTLVYFNSIRLPVNMGNFIESQPEAGFVSLEKNSFSNNSKILFHLPGEYHANLMYKIKGNEQLYREELKGNKDIDGSKVKISPAEGLLAIRNYTVIYALAVITVMLALIQSDIINLK